MAKTILRINEIAKLLGLKRDTIYKRVKKGDIPRSCYKTRQPNKKVFYLFSWEKIKELYNIETDIAYLRIMSDKKQNRKTMLKNKLIMRMERDKKNV